MTTLDDVTAGKRKPRDPLAEAEADRKIRKRASAGPDVRLRDGATTSAEPPDSTSASATPRTAALRSHLGERMATMPERLHKCSPYADKPASIRDVVTWTAAGGWVPGDNPWWVESVGYGWGVLVGIPSVAAINVASWVIHKFTHTAVVALLIWLLWMVSFLPPDLSWCGHSWLWFGAEVYAGLVLTSATAVLVNRPRGGS